MVTQYELTYGPWGEVEVTVRMVFTENEEFREWIQENQEALNYNGKNITLPKSPPHKGCAGWQPRGEGDG